MQGTLQQGFNVVSGVNNFGWFIPCLHSAQSKASPTHRQEEQPLPGLLAQAGSSRHTTQRQIPLTLDFSPNIDLFTQLPATASHGVLP